MGKHLMGIYLREIQTQINRAIISAKKMNDSLEKRETEYFFCEADHFLQHFSLVSKILYPLNSSGKKAAKRGNELRKTLNIPDNSALKNRNLRNHIEHFDDRLDSWAEEVKGRNVVDNNIGDLGAIVGDEIRKSDFLRNYDPGSKKYTFRGEEYSIQEMLDSLVSLEKEIIAANTHVIIG